MLKLTSVPSGNVVKIAPLRGPALAGGAAATTPTASTMPATNALRMVLSPSTRRHPARPDWHPAPHPWSRPLSRPELRLKDRSAGRAPTGPSKALPPDAVDSGVQVEQPPGATPGGCSVSGFSGHGSMTTVQLY